MEMIIIIAILVIAVLALVWRVVVLSRRNLWQSNEIELKDKVLKGERYSTNKIFKAMINFKEDNKRLQDQLNNLKGEYAKELKKLKAENKVLLAKCTFLEACNEEMVKKCQHKYKKGEFIKKVEGKLSTTTHPVSYGQMRDTFKCSQSSLTCALNTLIKRGKVIRVKQGWYKWNKTNNDLPDFPVK